MLGLKPKANPSRPPAVSWTVLVSATSFPSRTISARTTYLYVRPDFSPWETYWRRLPEVLVSNPLIVTLAAAGTQTVNRPLVSRVGAFRVSPGRSEVGAGRLTGGATAGASKAPASGTAGCGATGGGITGAACGGAGVGAALFAAAGVGELVTGAQSQQETSYEQQLQLEQHP